MGTRSRDSRTSGDEGPSLPTRVTLLVSLVALEEALEEIDRLGDSVSPLLADYALTIEAVVPVRHRHDRIPWADVEGTANDGRDVARLRAAAIGSGAALDVAVEATPVHDEALRVAISRAMRAVSSWGHEATGSDGGRLERFGRCFDSLVPSGDGPGPDAAALDRSVVRGVQEILHGAIAAERASRGPRPAATRAAEIAIASFARAVHHAVGVSRSVGEVEVDRACAGAVHGLVAMAAVA
ncbi:MAG: hypothetical protein M0Z33_00310 [Actinomycetota bacterium]|nr:hypothetical protein [Actinomycetota bacterium]